MHHAVDPGFVEGSLRVAALPDDCREKLAANPPKATETDSPNKQGGVGRQRQQHVEAFESIKIRFNRFHNILRQSIKEAKRIYFVITFERFKYDIKQT